MVNFAIIGVGGYIAPRHLKAIKDTDSHLLLATDPHDAVGIMDRFFPDCEFYTDIEKFGSRLESLNRPSSKNRIDYVSICSPNYLHESHIKMALKNGANAICEKPLVLDLHELNSLADVERDTGKKVFTVLQLRLLPQLVALKKELAATKQSRKHEVSLSYVTSRGSWYNASWKGDVTKSGGVATNIGIHFFDFLTWMFGSSQNFTVHLNEPNRMSGYLELEKANVSWFLSTKRSDLPPETVVANKQAYRLITIDGKELEFSDGFTDLHTDVYRDVLTRGGFGLDEARPAIELVHKIRTAQVNMSKGVIHPAAQRSLKEG
jgi:UDP-N-acetyl-2-amino-2-deoxyglucuronate dehydrogenase